MLLAYFPSSRSRRAAAAALLAALGAGAASAMQPAGSALESRLRAIEARLAALEGRGGAAPVVASTGQAVPCRSLTMNGSAITPAATLVVSVNGSRVGSFDDGAYLNLDRFMRPGVNVIGLAFAAPSPTASAELRCLPAGSTGSSRSNILTFKPSPGRLGAEAQVDFRR